MEGDKSKFRGITEDITKKGSTGQDTKNGTKKYSS